MVQSLSKVTKSANRSSNLVVIVSSSCAAQDFFEPQPEGLVTVFTLRLILHTWPDNECRRILTHLRDAAGPETRLVVIEDIVDYLCRESLDTVAYIPGAGRPMAPAPLLPYPDAICGFTYGMNMQVRGCCALH